MNESMCYVGLRECGCIRAVAVDSPQYKKETAKAVASWMKRGLIIERYIVSWCWIGTGRRFPGSQTQNVRHAPPSI